MDTLITVGATIVGVAYLYAMYLVWTGITGNEAYKAIKDRKANGHNLVQACLWAGFYVLCTAAWVVSVPVAIIVMWVRGTGDTGNSAQ